MLGSGTAPSTPQPTLQIEEEDLEVEGEDDDEDSDDTEDSDYGEEDEEEEEQQREEYENDVGVRSVLPGQAVLYVSAEESVEQVSCCQVPSLNPLQTYPTPML